MPRNHHPAASTLRNRIRVTNKTRLKIHQGSLDADAIFIPDEEEEKYHLTDLVAGVDAEDANEHHLQAVLSAAHRNSSNNRHSKASADKFAAAQPAFIPTPDSTGVVDNYDDLYPSNKWKDPATFIQTSQTVEEHIINGIANGFTYYMDDRDKEWLDRNNEEARGEGTSAQGALSASGTRTSARSAKSKGKDPESSRPAFISEDEFELVMGIFEKVTHEKTEYLHHGLETGMEFPAFSEYQDVFSAPLPLSIFATHTAPTWIPEPAMLLKAARGVYSYWKDRRVERGGHCIIPTLNGDESDTPNESFICFRRRETKAVRKTRASQVTFSDKLARLQAELLYPLELARSILKRETLKKEVVAQSQAVWEKRAAFSDIKRKFPRLSEKADEELLIDKETPTKRPDASRVPGLKMRANEQALLPQPRPEVVIWPKERLQTICDSIDAHLEKQMDIDLHWEDKIDNPYQVLPVSYASRLFKYIPPPSSPSRSSSNPNQNDEDMPPSAAASSTRAVRMRYGRGGRIILDRRDAIPRRPTSLPRSLLFAPTEIKGDDEIDVDKDPEAVERLRRLEDQWKYDMDDEPHVGPAGSDEKDRILVDDYNPTYLRHAMTLYTEHDHVNLMNDPSLVVNGGDGRQRVLMPYRLGMPPPVTRRDQHGLLRAYPPNGFPQQAFLAASGTPVATQHQVKKMQPPTAVPQMRISSNGGMRPPVAPASNHQANASALPACHASPQHPHPVTISQHPPPIGANGIGRASITVPHVEVQKPEVVTTPALSNGDSPLPRSEGDADVTVNGVPARAKSHNPSPQSHLGLSVPTNGYHLTPMSSMAAAALVNPTSFQQHNQTQQSQGLSPQQVQNLKSAFANMPASDFAAFQANWGIHAPYMHLPRGASVNMPIPQGTNMNLKLPANARQMQWHNAAMQRPASAVNVMETQLNGTHVPGSNLGHPIPVLSPSAKVSRP